MDNKRIFVQQGHIGNQLLKGSTDEKSTHKKNINKWSKNNITTKVMTQEKSNAEKY